MGKWLFFTCYLDTLASQVAQAVKNLPDNAGDAGSIPGWGRSPGDGNGNPLQYSCLGNPWTEEPDWLRSMGLQRVRHNLVTKQPLPRHLRTYF